MPLIDVHSSIEALTLQPRTGLGMPCFVVKMPDTSGTGGPAAPTYKEFRTLKQFKDDPSMADLQTNDVLLGKLETIFDQDNRHEKFAILKTEDIKTGLDQFKDNEFFFILSADEVTENKMAIAQYANSAQNKRLRIAILQEKTVALGKAYNLLKNVVCLYSPVDGEYFDAAITANVGSLQVGSVTWKFKEVRGVTTQYLSEETMLEIDDARMIAYAYKHGSPQTTEGWASYITADDVIPQYIDDLMGAAWVRYDVEKRMAKSLKVNPKLPYDNRGIKVLEGDATTTLLEASNMGIVGQDDDGVFVYRVQALPRDSQTPEDIVTRKYRGISYAYRKSGAIHEVWVSGTVEF